MNKHGEAMIRIAEKAEKALTGNEPLTPKARMDAASAIGFLLREIKVVAQERSYDVGELVDALEEAMGWDWLSDPENIHPVSKNRLNAILDKHMEGK